MEIELPNLRWLKCEKVRIEIVTSTQSRGLSRWFFFFLPQTTFETLFMEIEKEKRGVLTSFWMEAAEMCFQKHKSILDFAKLEALFSILTNTAGLAIRAPLSQTTFGCRISTSSGLVTFNFKTLVTGIISLLIPIYSVLIW